ncbi:hypothetical protein RSOL_092840, partial [Rhizoctonia solani AG-3 Rhs1AP]
MSTDNKSSQPSVKRPRSDSPESEQAIENKSSLLAVEYSGRKIVILRSANYANTIASIKKAFSQLRNVSDQQIQLFVKLEQLDDLAQVVEDLWDELVPSLPLVRVVMTTLPTPSTNSPPNNRIEIKVRTGTGVVQSFNASSTCTVFWLKLAVYERMFASEHEAMFCLTHKLYYKGSLMDNFDTLSRWVKDGDELELRKRTV